MSISNLHHQNNSICKEKYQNRTYKNETYNDGETTFQSYSFKKKYIITQMEKINLKMANIIQQTQYMKEI